MPVRQILQCGHHSLLIIIPQIIGRVCGGFGFSLITRGQKENRDWKTRHKIDKTLHRFDIVWNIPGSLRVAHHAQGRNLWDKNTKWSTRRKDGSDEFCRAVKKLSYGQPYFVKSAFFCRTDKLLIRHFVGVIPSLSLKEALKLLTERKPDFSAISAMDLSGLSSKARFA